MLAKGPEATRSKHLMRLIGTIVLALLASLSVVQLRFRSGFAVALVVDQPEFGQRHRGPFG